MRTIQLLILVMLCAAPLCAQEIALGADVRQRFEYRHGFNNLIPDNTDAAAFVRQRSRLNINYNSEKLKVFIALQDVSTWGDTRQISPVDDNNSFMLFQAWAQLRFNEHWSTKLGRQVLAYDDQRIFGGLDWAMQGRFHDAALIKYAKQDLKIDLGFAYSQQGEPIRGTLYNIPGFFTYKTLQFAHLNKTWGKTSASLLLLNTGFQDFEDVDRTIADGTYYTHTVGSYVKFPAGPVNFAASAYYQFGDAYPINNNLSAYQVSLEGSYKSLNNLFALGVELLSGSDQESVTNNSFFPLYGTNHKFNGFMDYFYVGNHANSVGLNDLYAKTVIKTSTTSNLLIKAHYFMANAKLVDDADRYLGTEVDLVFTQPLLKNVKLNIGYSHLFASTSMSLIKGGLPSDNTNNWGWVQLIISPTLFTHVFDK